MSSGKTKSEHFTKGRRIACTGTAPPEQHQALSLPEDELSLIHICSAYDGLTDHQAHNVQFESEYDLERAAAVVHFAALEVGSVQRCIQRTVWDANSDELVLVRGLLDHLSTPALHFSYQLPLCRLG